MGAVAPVFFDLGWDGIGRVGAVVESAMEPCGAQSGCGLRPMKKYRSSGAYVQAQRA